jgi:OOP family OmpA-OmpF porin
MKRNPIHLLLISGIVFLNAITYAQENIYIISKYDFISGEKVIFFDDFTSEGIGDFPAQWLTNGSGEIVTSQKFPGKWFNITKMGYYIPEAKDDFTDNFTIEFDFIPMTIDNSENLYSFTFYLLTGSLTEPGGGGEPGDAGFQVYSDGENLGWKNFSLTNEQRFNGNVTFPFKTNQKYHVAIWVQKQRVRLYANETKVLDLPRGIPTGGKPNIFRFDTRDEAIPLIANFRIAAGMSDMRNRLLNDGKIVSYGIYFDVNSDKLKPESYSTLRVIADILKEDPSLKLQVVGHTDSDGDDVSNLDLSRRRAISVKNELVAKFGCDATRLETDGKGESEPLADNNSPLNKAKNRRVEFINLKQSSRMITSYSATTEIKITATSETAFSTKEASPTPNRVSVNKETGSFKDPRDGKEYKTVKIGTQIWMAENLAFKIDSGYSIIENSEGNLAIYGYLYNLSAASIACPAGWHLPSIEDYIALAVYSGDKVLSGAYAKGNASYSSGGIASKWKSPSLWQEGNFPGTNESGFSALPGGQDDGNPKMSTIGYIAEWWSSTPYKGNWGNLGNWSTSIHNSESGIMIMVNNPKIRSSVRCLKD